MLLLPLLRIPQVEPVRVGAVLKFRKIRLDARLEVSSFVSATLIIRLSGFAVVVSEVRVLANCAADAASEIKALIDDSARYVSEGDDRVNSTAEALTGVIGHVAQLSELMSGISNEVNEQAQRINEVNIEIGQLDRVTQENVTMVETSNGAIQSMNRAAITLANLEGQFKLRR